VRSRWNDTGMRFVAVIFGVWFGFVRYERVSKRQYRCICIYEYLRTVWLRRERNGRRSAFGGPVQSASFVQCTNPSCSLRSHTSISPVYRSGTPSHIIHCVHYALTHPRSTSCYVHYSQNKRAPKRPCV
jgi:hypothetical protein